MRSSSRSASPTLRVSCIQNNAGAESADNLRRIRGLVHRALAERPDIIALPENFLWRGPGRELQKAEAEVPEAVRFFKKIARETRTAFLLGSLVEASGRKGLFYNTSLLIDRTGTIRARYRKIHLFDVRLSADLCVRESKYTCAGNRLVTALFDGLRLGFSICYDLRFPELFRSLALRGCRVVFLPANFTAETGQAHWEVLLRARAIENQIFIVAPAQTGVNSGNGVRSFGSSMIIDPWGTVLVRAGRRGEAVITAMLDLGAQVDLRRRMPVLRHRRLF